MTVAATKTDEVPTVAQAGVTKQTMWPAAVIDDPQLLHVIADAGHVGQQPYFPGDIIAETPEIDHIAAGSQSRRALDQRRRKSTFPEPEGQGRSGDARPLISTFMRFVPTWASNLR